jgi:hypothetical protein
MRDVQMQWDIEHIRADVSAIRYYVEKAEHSWVSVAMAFSVGVLLGMSFAGMQSKN